MPPRTTVPVAKDERGSCARSINRRVLAGWASGAGAMTVTIELPPTDPPEAELTIRFDGAICRTLHIGLMGGGLISWNAKLWGGGNGQARDPIPYALETDWPVGAAGFEPLHIRIGIRQDSQPGGRDSNLRISN